MHRTHLKLKSCNIDTEPFPNTHKWTPKILDPYSGRTENIGHFSIFLFFIFFEKKVVQPFFQQKIFFLPKFLVRRTFQKIMKNFLENNITSKNCLIKNFGCTHNRHKKIQFFRFFWVLYWENRLF